MASRSRPASASMLGRRQGRDDTGQRPVLPGRVRVGDARQAQGLAGLPGVVGLDAQQAAPQQERRRVAGGRQRAECLGARAGGRRRSARGPGRASPGSAAVATAPSGRRRGWPSGRWPRAREPRARGRPARWPRRSATPMPSGRLQRRPCGSRAPPSGLRLPRARRAHPGRSAPGGARSGPPRARSGRRWPRPGRARPATAGRAASRSERWSQTQP